MFFFICDINVLLLTGEVHTRFWWRDLSGRDGLKGLGIGERMILKWIYKKWDWEALTGLMWLRIGQVRGVCECGNEPSGSTQCWEFLD
jgi:hypothetical protein